MTYREAKSLATLKAEIDRAAPHRSTRSDGWIGDAAHAARTSDHNPWVTRDGVGIVRARDFTHDPAGGLDCNRLARRLARLMRKGTHPALESGAYIIFDRRIISRDRIGEGWRPYPGSNPHTQHLHLSVSRGIGYDSPRPWGVMGGGAAERRRQRQARRRRRRRLARHAAAQLEAAREALVEAHRLYERAHRRRRAARVLTAADLVSRIIRRAK